MIAHFYIHWDSGQRSAITIDLGFRGLARAEAFTAVCYGSLRVHHSSVGPLARNLKSDVLGQHSLLRILAEREAGTNSRILTVSHRRRAPGLRTF